MTEKKSSSSLSRLSIGVLLGVLFFMAITKIPALTKKPEVQVPTKKVEAKIFDQYLVHTKIRSNQNPVTPAQQKAYDLYAQQDFVQAMPLLEKLYEDEKDYLAYYYLGICHFFRGENKKAEEIFQDRRLKFYKLPM